MMRRFLSAIFATLCTLGLLIQTAGAQMSLTSINTVIGNSFVSTAEGSFVDSYGNVYIANATGTTVVEIPANGGAPITLGTGFVSIRGLVADSHGNVYIAQTNVTSITKIPAGGGTPVGIGSVSRPFLIAIDSSDTIYVTDTNNSRIVKIAYGATTQTNLPVTVPTGSGASVRGVAVDSTGHIYVSLLAASVPVTNPIVRLNNDGSGQVNVNITGISGLQGIAFDAKNNLYVLDGTDGKLLEYPAPLVDAPGVNTPITIATNTSAVPVAVTVSPRGDIIYNSTKVYAAQTNVANFYDSPLLTASGAATLTFTSATAKTFTAPVFTSEGSTTALFKDAGAETAGCIATKSVAAGGTCTVNVSFTPTQVGLANGTVTVMDNSTPAVALITVPLTGVGSAPLVSFAPGTASSFVTGLTTPAGLTTDLAGNVYSVDMGAAKVAKVSSAGASTALAFTGLQRPVGVAVDGALNVYVSDANNNAVYKLSGATQTTVATTGLSAPKGIALDGLNNLYIADSGNARVVKIDVTGAQTVLPLTGLAAPAWVAVDNAGNVYVSDTGKVYEYTIAGAQKTLTTTGLTAPAGIVAGADSTLYIADGSNNNIYALLTSGTSFTLGGALATPTGVTIAANGNLYISNSTTGAITLLDRTKQTLTFPGTATGATSAAQTAVVQNTGNGALTYSVFAVSAGFAQVTPTTATDCTASSVVAYGATCNVNILFEPTTLGTVNGSVTQTDNALNGTSTQTISLVGTGIRATTTTLATTTPATGNPVYGATFTVTATVTPTTTGGPAPTGSVTFAVDGGAPSTGVALNASAQAQYSPMGLAAGAHTIVATYSGDAANAASTSATFNVTVAPAVLTVTATSQTRAYNVANAPLAYTITGYVNGDASSVVTGAPALATTATTTSDPGTYPITVAVGTLSAANYTFNLVNGTITVTKASNTITFPALANVTYGVSPIALAATANSGLAITYSVVSGPATVTNGAGAAVTITGAGPVTIAANQAGNTDYSAATQVTQSFTVAPAVLTVAADPQSKQQGQANPTLTYTITGFKYSDTQATATMGAPSVTTTAVTNSPTGTYPITVAQGTLAAANYTFNLVGNTLTVTGTTAQTITFGTLPPVTYGVGPITLGATASSGLAITYLLVSGPATLAGNVLTITGIGTVTVKATQAGNATYAAAPSVTQSFAVNPATLTVTTPNVSRTINTPNLTFMYMITGYVNGENSTVVSGAPSITTTAQTNSPVGTYPITVTQGSLTAANYVFTFVGATLTVTSAPQTITFGAIANVTYGVSPIMLTATASSGLAVSYAVTGPATLSGSALTITGVGQVCVTASQAGDATYAAATPVQQCFTVAKAALTVTASNASITYGAAIPTSFAYTITGFVNGETTAVVSGTPSITTTATASSPGGTYPITPTVGTLTASNYAFTTFVPGTLTIGQATQTITFAALPNIPQTMTTVTLTATASSGLAIVYTVTGPATVAGNVLSISGPGTVSATATQPGNSSFSAATPVTQTFNVTGTTSTALTVSTAVTQPGLSVMLTATVTGHITGSNPTGTVQFYVNGAAFGAAVTCGTPTGGTCKAALSTTALPSGTPTIYAAYSGDNFFTASSSTTNAEPIQVIAGDFNVTATSTNLTIQAGDSANTTITLSPVGAYSDTVKLSCSSLPANMYCTFLPPALNFYPGTGVASAPQSTVLTVTAKAQTTAALRGLRGEGNGVELAALFFGLPLAGWMLRRRKKMLRVALLLLLAAGVSVGVTGCGSNVTNLTAPGTYNIHVDMTDGTSVTHTLTVTVTVQ